MNRLVVVCIFVAVTVVWIGSYWVVRSAFPSLEQSGQIGDLFGAVNALFSGLAFAGVLIAIWLQRTDLQLQHKALQVQIQEMKDSRMQLAEQAKAQRIYAVAMIAQLKVSAIELEVRGIEMLAADSSLLRHEYVAQIKRQAEEIKHIVAAFDKADQ